MKSLTALPLAASLLLLHALLPAQSNLPAPFAVGGPAVFDASGNLYVTTTSGPTTEGVLQPRMAIGTCVGPFKAIPVNCPDVYISKADAAGTLVFGTFLGGIRQDLPSAIAVGPDGSVFIAGTTHGDFPTTPQAAIREGTSPLGFAARISGDGKQLLYSTYLPAGFDAPRAIAVDAAGQAVIAGSGSGDARVVKLNATGSAFLYQASLAGSADDAATAVALDSTGAAAIAGWTASNDFPVTTAAIQPRIAGGRDAFVAKVRADGSIAFATYLGGSADDEATVVAVDAAGDIVVAGKTISTDFRDAPDPVVPLWNHYGPGAFAAKVRGDGSGLEWTRYLMNVDSLDGRISALVLSGSGDVFVAGVTGAGFPVTESAPRLCFNGGAARQPAAFVARLDSAGTLRDATYVNEWTGAALLLDGADFLLPRYIYGSQATLRLTFDPSRAPAPCLSPQVLSAASMAGGAGVVPGALISLTGFGIGPAEGVAGVFDEQGRMPLELAGVKVLFDGRQAPLLYVQSRQINAIAPDWLTPAESPLDPVRKTRISVEYRGVEIGSTEVNVNFGGYEVFRLDPGRSNRPGAMNEDGARNGPMNPAARGSVVSLWGTGIGPTVPSCAAGTLNPPGPASLAGHLDVVLSGGGKLLPAEYNGGAPGMLCGIVQVNLRIPEDIAPGKYEFFLWSRFRVGEGYASNQNGNIVVLYVK